MKDFNEEGIVWFSNYESQKGIHLQNNPFAAGTFWWGDLERSIRLEGKVEKCPEEESDKRFSTAPRGFKINAHAHDQSRPAESPEEVAQLTKDTEAKFAETSTE